MFTWECFSSCSQFGFYNSNETVVEMKKQDVSWSDTYIKCVLKHLYVCRISLVDVQIIQYCLLFPQWYLSDVFGLKTLDSRGAVIRCNFSEVRHVDWHSDLTVYKTCIEEWLTWAAEDLDHVIPFLSCDLKENIELVYVHSVSLDYSFMWNMWSLLIVIFKM